MKSQGELKYTETVTDNYMFHEQEKTVTIPKDVPNGAFSTDIEVEYVRKIIADNMLKPFTSYDLLSDGQDSIYNHLKPGFEQNEPVFVHTPVIAPVTIKDTEETTQLITEHKTGSMSTTEEDDYGNCWYSDDTTFYIPPWAIEGNYSENGEGRQSYPFCTIPDGKETGKYADL